MQTDSMNPAEPEVEGQRLSRSDERLKQAVDQVEGALASLRELDGPEVEGQRLSRSDERLKQSVGQVEGALKSLQEL